MNLKDCIKKREGKTVVKNPDIRINKYWSIETGTYWDTLNRKRTKDFYIGFKFNLKW